MNIQQILDFLRGVNPALADAVTKMVNDHWALVAVALPVEHRGGNLVAGHGDWSDWKD